MKVTFDDVMDKYTQARDCMGSNMEIVQEVFDRTTLASHINVPTLARWLYGPSQEFLNDYRVISFKYVAHNMDASSERKEQIAGWQIVLSDLVKDFRIKLLEKFSTSSELVEVVA